MSNNLVKLCSTFFYVGYMPFFPGSTASILGALIYVLFYQHIAAYAVIGAVLALLGFLTAGRMGKLTNDKDPSCVVIDEVAGIMIALFMLPKTPGILWTAFFVFRAFDMFKIFPINKLELLPGSKGIMMDDMMAGLYTNIVMRLSLGLAGVVPIAQL